MTTAEADGRRSKLEIRTDGIPRSFAERILRWIWWSGVLVLTVLVCALGWLVAVSEVYRPGDDIGYNLGLAGGLLMLSLLLYPLRKRVKWLDRLGSMLYWFRYHMVAGIAGPVLVLFHSTFKIGSMNGRVALYCMLLVAASGVVGRFIYRHIHRHLYSRQLTMVDAEKNLTVRSAALSEIFHSNPEIEKRLSDYRKYAFAQMNGSWASMVCFMSLRARGQLIWPEIRTHVRKATKTAIAGQQPNREQRILMYRLAKERVTAYVDAICVASQLKSWEQMFSLWHIVHIPFLYLLIISAIVHVVAVHIY